MDIIVKIVLNDIDIPLLIQVPQITNEYKIWVANIRMKFS